MSLQSDVGEGFELEMGEEIGSSGSIIIHCGRCGKPKTWYGIWGQESPQLCECLPLENWKSGQFRDKTKGWECPKCNRVYAPSVDECGHCQPSQTFQAIIA